MKKKTCYYAHFMGIYDTPAEARDIATLMLMGFEVTNPNTPAVQEAFELYRATHPDGYMAYFQAQAAKHDIVAFRALPNGLIPGGVSLEITAALAAGKLVIELPCGIISRGMNHATTVEYLENSGQR